ncbi:MAG: hypothetical protein EOM50_08755 [Erysipelotrichia bacterium]|nr:hypothetical protein [Erysipelotrichia bacterium]
MALKTEETEFLNRIDQILFKNLNSLEDQVNGLLDDKSIEKLFEISKYLQDLQNSMLYFQMFMVAVVLMTILFVYSILSGKFLSRIYNSVYTRIVKDFEDAMIVAENCSETIKNSIQQQTTRIQEVGKLIENQHQVTAYIYQLIQAYQHDLDKVRTENTRLHAELMKSHNILRKKIRKSEGENNAWK